MTRWTSTLSRDLPAGLVVFLVAVPLCIGIATASGAPAFAGILAGVIGGVVVGALSRSSLSVSGPAAGLAVIVAGSIEALGFRGFLLSVVLAGLMQLALGAVRAGALAHFVPSAVIKGMLAAIGVILVLKQLPHAVGHDGDFEGDEAFRQQGGDNTLTTLWSMIDDLRFVAVAVALVGVAVLFAWPRLQKLAKPLSFVPAALVVVVLGAISAVIAGRLFPGEMLTPDHMVSLPVFSSPGDVLGALVLPDFARITDPAVWKAALTLAIVASIETLLSLEAVDRLDPQRRISPPNRELVAQGVGNALSGLVGGLPVTSVIVRSSANVHAGAQSRTSTITHGVLLLVGALALSPLLNHVPLAALAVVLIAVGAKLARPALFVEMYKGGLYQLVPFLVTLLAVVFTDLLTGTLIGVLVGVGFVLHQNQRNGVQVTRDDSTKSVLVRFLHDMSFLDKAALKNALQNLPEDVYVIIDGTRAREVDADIAEVIRDFEQSAVTKGQRVERRRSPSAGHALFRPDPVPAAPVVGTGPATNDDSSDKVLKSTGKAA